MPRTPAQQIKPAPAARLPGVRVPEVWLQDRVNGKARRKRFHGFEGEIRCTDPTTFNKTVSTIEQLRRSGKHLAGFITYEAGYLTEPVLTPLLPADRAVPLIWMGIFAGCKDEVVSPAPPDEARSGAPVTIENLTPEMDRPVYENNINRILDYIKAGDIYQTNFTWRASFDWSGQPLDLFDALTATQPVPYAAWIDTGEDIVLSLSPELFFEISNGTIRTRPMKGTAKRGRTTDEDDVLAKALQDDPKERAENLMILDLMRNDLSRVAVPGTVKVPERFTVERYRTVHQMTSSVEASLKPGTDFPALLDAIFPCGSVTGAPKVRAMEIISELEQSPRGVYTGAIGHLDPDGSAAFNVAIRTLTLKPAGQDKWRGSVGVGGGIVYDSTPAREYEECQVKIAFLNNPVKAPIELIETMKCENGGVFLLQEHLARLENSARYLDFPCDRTAIEKALRTAATQCATTPSRLRLLLGAEGTFSLTHTPLEPARAAVRFTIAKTAVNSADPFLFHKTTRRTLFDDTLAAQAARVGAHEVLFLNERGELTEGTRANLFIEKDGILLTPPLTCGCLPGTLRAHLLGAPQSRVQEQSLKLADLYSADAIFFGNSVRGLERARLISDP